MIETMIIVSEIVRRFEIRSVQKNPVAPKLTILTRPKRDVVMSVEPFLPVRQFTSNGKRHLRLV